MEQKDFEVVRKQLERTENAVKDSFEFNEILHKQLTILDNMLAKLDEEVKRQEKRYEKLDG